MQKTYKCKKGHKFKSEEGIEKLCPTCNEPAEPVKWNTVNEFNSNSKGFGLVEELGSIVNTLKGK